MRHAGARPAEVRFVLLSLVASPSVRPVYQLPDNVSKLITVPLWGTGEVLEIRRDLSLIDVIRRQRSAPVSAVRAEFVPLFRRFLPLLWTRRHSLPPQARPCSPWPPTFAVETSTAR